MQTSYMLDDDEDTLIQEREDFDEYNALDEDDAGPEDRRRDPLRRPV